MPPCCPQAHSGILAVGSVAGTPAEDGGFPLGQKGYGHLSCQHDSLNETVSAELTTLQTHLAVTESAPVSPLFLHGVRPSVSPALLPKHSEDRLQGRTAESQVGLWVEREGVWACPSRPGAVGQSGGPDNKHPAPS